MMQQLAPDHCRQRARIVLGRWGLPGRLGRGGGVEDGQGSDLTGGEVKVLGKHMAQGSQLWR